MYSIQQYSSNSKPIWDAFVKTSKNGTFLFLRDFMEYHADRFTDHSLLVYEGQKLVALLPAHVDGDKAFSHYGLTYGGLVLPGSLRLEKVTDIFKAILLYFNQHGFSVFNIKTIPYIYHKIPSQELEYALFLSNAVLKRRDSLSVIETLAGGKVNSTRKQEIKKGLKNNLVITEEEPDSFWQEILIPNLKDKHNATPVHSLAEIKRLQECFPDNIRHFNVYHESKLVAGATMFVTETTAHAQYISGDENKTLLGSVDFLFSELITKTFSDKKFFDFGTSNENQGRVLNKGLAYWKESFGARTIVQDFYEVPTENYKQIP